MKSPSVFVLSLLLFSAVVTPAYATVDSRLEPSRSMNAERPIRIGEPNPNGDRIEKKVGNLQERADKEITRRITSLQNLLDRLENVKTLSADEKAVFMTQIQTEIDNLTTLQAKINANIDPVSMRTDVQSVVTSHRIYAFLFPKISILVAADRMGDTANKLGLMASQLQTKLSDAKAQGRDVGSLETVLADMKKKIADAKTQEQNAVNAVMPLTVAGYPANKTAIEAANEMLKLGYQDLIGARRDAKTIIDGLR